MSRRRLCAALLALAVVLCAAAASVAPAAPIVPVASYAQRLTLRLVDVGPGYMIGNDSGCGSAIAGEGTTEAVTRIYLAHRHTGCIAEFLEVWAPTGTSPRPGAITSAAYRFHDTAGPAAELHHARAVIEYVAGVSRASLTPLPAPALGDEALAFRTDDMLVESLARAGVVVLWRTGRTLALILVGGRPAADDEQAATRLAAVQQQRIERPTPLRPSDDDDLEVPLDNPAFHLGVRWLGRALDPPGRLPRLQLSDAQAPVTSGEGPGWYATLDYTGRRLDTDVRLGIWRPQAWKRFARSRLGRLVWHEACVRSQRIAVAGGRAVVYAGFQERQTRCGAKRPDRFLAHVFFAHQVISVNAVDCLRCRDASGPYNSMAGMRAVVRALRPRMAKPLAPAAITAG